MRDGIASLKRPGRECCPGPVCVGRAEVCWGELHATPHWTSGFQVPQDDKIGLSGLTVWRFHPRERSTHVFRVRAAGGLKKTVGVGDGVFTPENINPLVTDSLENWQRIPAFAHRDLKRKNRQCSPITSGIFSLVKNEGNKQMKPNRIQHTRSTLKLCLSKSFQSGL